MAITNYTDREVQFKLVIHGPPFAGKTTILRRIQADIEAASVSEVKARKSGADTTLEMNFVPENATLLDDFKIRFEILTVPGNVVFNAPRKLALRDADGILFAADSEWDKIAGNVESFANLEENFKKLGADLEQTPVVLLYNKRDLPEAAPAGYLDFVLNNRKLRMPSFEVTATTGTNVFNGLRALTRMVIHRFAEGNAKQPSVTRDMAPAG